ncbi:MAG: type II toxin-antitoxin system VapC family toxin [Mesorhizobium sp.]|nr:MAG: type II toxin-antitoxin system VapC family toxin [Mesorhizobium sp.]
MTDEQDRTPSPPDNAVVRRLVREANITEEQARELIDLLRSDWPSLMREARFLTRKR